jgi:hypothetical protein
MPRSSGPHGPVEMSEAAEEAHHPTTHTASGTVPAQPISGIGSDMIENTAIPPAINWADGLNVEIPGNLNIDWSEYEVRQTPTPALC